MQVHIEAINILSETFENIQNIYSRDNLQDLKSELSNCFLMPNQMIYAIAYNPFKVFFCKNVKNILGMEDEMLIATEMITRICSEDVNFITDVIRDAFKWMLLNPDEALDIIFLLEYRIQHTNGHFITVQRSSRVLDSDIINQQFATLSVLSDISQLHRDNFKAKAAMYNTNTDEQYFSFTNMVSSQTKISARENEVLKLLSFGLSSKEIAKKLFISKHTVDGHRRKLLEKTKLSNTTQLVSYAIQNHLIEV